MNLIVIHRRFREHRRQQQLGVDGGVQQRRGHQRRGRRGHVHPVRAAADVVRSAGRHRRLSDVGRGRRRLVPGDRRQLDGAVARRFRNGGGWRRRRRVAQEQVQDGKESAEECSVQDAEKRRRQTDAR